MSTHISPDSNRFRHTRFRAGYAADEVDLFVRAVEDALSSGSPRLGAPDVAGHQFTQVLLQPGYRIDDVDDYLDQAETRLLQRERER